MEPLHYMVCRNEVSQLGNKTVLIIGGGPAGIQSALEQAESGNTVYLVENTAGIGGERLLYDEDSKTVDFVSPDLEKVKNNKNIRIITNADIEKVEDDNGKFGIRIKKRAIRVIEEKCNDCKACIKVCPVNLWDDEDQGLSFRTAIDFFNHVDPSYNIVKEAPVCQRACPVHLDIRGYIGFIADGKFKESLALIKEVLPFPSICGHICPHPCEEECNRGKVDFPLSIRDLKRFVADIDLQDSCKSKPGMVVRGANKGKKVAIIGAGPAGLACAYDLALLGYGVTVFEALPRPGGMLAVGIPDYRLPRDVLEKEIDAVSALGVEIRCNTVIGKGLSLDDLFEKGYEAVFITVGAHKNQEMRIPGEDALGVIPGVTFLRDLNLGNPVDVGGRVAVIGGGNVAIDSARCALRLGARDVTILYRRSRQEMPASDEEIEAALEEGIKIEYLVAPLQVFTADGKVASLRCMRMELGKPDASGRRMPIPVEGSEFDIELDTLIPAIGQVPDISFLGESSEIELTKKGTIAVNPDTLETSRPGVFAGGDCQTGPKIAVEAVAAGKKAAVSIDKYLRGK
ncbi:MAG: FAD-dependent oxidoreductase [Thermodesulfobacteriota bacterium]